MGHLARTLALAGTFGRNFRVALILITETAIEVNVPPGVTLHVVAPPTHTMNCLHSTICDILEVIIQADAAAFIVEYFPFGRLDSAFIYAPLIRMLRSRSQRNLKVLSSVRDIMDADYTPADAELMARFANQYFDGILVHSQPSITRFEDTFSAFEYIRIPIYYTNYVSRHAPVTSTARESASNTVLVSVGGGRTGGSLLRCAIASARANLLNGYRMKILAGKMLFDNEWEDLVASCAGMRESLELHRWVPDLFEELCRAAVSVSRCGYNTTQDVLTSGVRALMIPCDLESQDEQVQRARILSRLGLVRVLPESEMTPESLAREIQNTAMFERRPLKLRFNGTDRTPGIVTELIAGRHPASEAE
jgi:predicted glycosyltransferase